MHSVCIAEVHVIVNYINILSIAQQCLCGEFMSPATMKRTYVFMWRAKCCMETKTKCLCPWPSLDERFGYADRNDRQVVAHFLRFWNFCRETFYKIRCNRQIMKAIDIKYCENVSLYSYLSCVATRSHPSHAVLRFHLWPFWLYQVFPHCPLKGRIFWKKKRQMLLNEKLFRFSVSFYSKHSLF